MPNPILTPRPVRLLAGMSVLAGMLASVPQASVAQPAGAAPQPPAALIAAPRAGEVLLNFQSADLQAVVKAMSQMTGRNMMIDPRVKGQFTVVSARPMPVAAAYAVFLSALKAQGFTAVEGPENTVRIIPIAEAKLSAPVNEQDTPPGGAEQIVTHVVIGQHISVSQLQVVLRPLMSPTSQLSAYDPVNALIITDFADNVRRLLRIIEKIDLPASGAVTFVPLQHASAIDLAEMVVRLSGSGVSTPGQIPGAPPTQVAAGGDRFSIVADTRTNSLLLRSDSAGRIAQLSALIARLDVPARAIGSTRVIYLKHAEAERMVEVLRGMLAGEARATAAAAAPTLAASGRPAAAARGQEASLIQADEATNSIIINASDAVYNNLRLVIEKLDVRRAQVYVEALIVEMTADRTDELGIQWAGGGQRGSRTVGGMTNFPGAGPGIAEVAANPSAGITAAGLSFAILGPKITLANGTTVRNLAGLARALEATSMANILSTPTLLTLDNASARIVVGQNVPFVTGSFAQATAAVAGGPVNPFQTIERRDVGLTLKLKPQISEGGMIRLEIYQEVSSVDPTSRGLASDVVLNKRALETKVVIDDGNTIVLGGLIDNRVTESVQAVPLLGSIPLLGALFRFKRSVVARTNLMIFLRPVIVRSADDGYRVTADRYEYLRAYAPEGAEREAIFDRLAPVAPGVGVPPRATDPVPPGAAPRDPGRETAPEPAKP